MEVAFELCNASEADRNGSLCWLLAARADANMDRRYLDGDCLVSTTPLYVAALHGHAEIVSTLLAAGALANTGESMEHEAAVFEKTFRPALSIATIQGHEAVVRLLLGGRADVDRRSGDETGSTTPLFQAVRRNFVEIVRLLLDAKANANAPEIHGLGVCPFARDTWPLATALGQGCVQIVRLLLAARADVNAGECQENFDDEFALQCTTAATPLFYASGAGHVEVARLLVDAEADINKGEGKDDRRLSMRRHTTPLRHAEDRAQTEVVRLLEAGGAEARFKD